MVGKAPTATGVAIYLALVQSANSKKKEDRLCGKVDLLLRRKEIRVVLLFLCKSNNRATILVFNLFCVFAGAMGFSGDGRWS
ncbi:MAG: hypothetical protein WC256_00300 [Desulfurivibrionaceae bacterium]|jgi:hypothetical protein